MSKNPSLVPQEEKIEFSNKFSKLFEFLEQVPFWIVTWRGQNFNEEKLSGGNQGKEMAVTTPNLDPWLPPLNVD